MRRAFAVLLLTSAVAPPRADSAPLPVGPQFEVNSYTTGEQITPAIASQAGGGFVVTWESAGSSAGDTDSYSLQGQRFSAAGTPQGPQFQINSYTTGVQRSSAIASDADGNFVVVWESYGSDGGDTSSWSVQGQRFSAAGGAQGAQFQVNTFTTAYQASPAIASQGDGEFVVVWRSLGSTGGDSSLQSVQGRRYTAAGVPQGGEFQINSYTTGSQIQPAIAIDAEGDAVVVWGSSNGSGGDNFSNSIQAQRFSAAGAPQGAQFQVNSYTPSEQDWAKVAIGGGAGGIGAEAGFIAVWQSQGSSGGDTSSKSVQGQRYSAAGVPQGGQFQVNSYTSSFQGISAIASDADGDFVVVWQSIGSGGGDSADSSVQGQRYLATGAPDSAQFQVNSYTTASQQGAAIASDASGDFVVVWHSIGSSGSDTSGSSVQGQRFRVTGDLAGRAFLDRNSDGMQDSGEPGLAGIGVELYGPADPAGVPRRAAVTDGSGDYVLKPKEGEWTVKFVPPSNGFTFTARDVGNDDAIDSDADPATGETEPFRIEIDILDDSLDVGFLPIIFADGFESADSSAWSATVP